MYVQVGVHHILITKEDGTSDHIWISKDFVDKNVDQRIFKALVKKSETQDPTIKKENDLEFKIDQR